MILQRWFVFLTKSKGVKILKNDSKYKIIFENVAYVYRAIKNGYIDIGGEKLSLTDDDKQNLKSAAEETSRQMEQNLLQATAEHEAHVAKQQAEALSEEAKRQGRILEIASRIMKGEKVSPEEENELAESDPKLYAMAKQAQMLEKESDNNHESREINHDRDKQQENKSSEEDDKDWISPLRQIHELRVSMDVEKSIDGFNVESVIESVG